MEQQSAERPANKEVVQILFEERDDGFWWLSGQVLARFKRLTGLRCDGDSAGFRWPDVYGYAERLAKQGVTVGLARKGGITIIGKPKSGKPPKVPTGSIFLAPELLMPEEERRQLAIAVPLREGTTAELEEADLGKIFVYQVGLGLYEIDWELTTVPKAGVQLLLLSAYRENRKVHCHLVVPKSQRQGRHIPSPRLVDGKEPEEFGQISLLS